MKAIFVGVVSAIVVAGVAGVSAQALNVTGNVGSDVTIKNACSTSGIKAIGNVGSDVIIDANGQCDVQTVANNVNLTGNVGSDIIIKNVCGGTSTSGIKALGNVGSDIKVTSVGACKAKEVQVPTKPVDTPVQTSTPTQPVVTASSVTKEAQANTNSEANAATAELPVTGANEVVAAVVSTILAATTYGGTMAIRAFRARA